MVEAIHYTVISVVATGQVVHPYMGISYGPLNPAISAQLGLPETTAGIVIGRVATGSPADDAQLKRGDVITMIDDAPLEDDSVLAQVINNHKPGDTLTLTVLRGAQKLTLRLTLGEALSPQ